jgi:hypothetical protein
LLVDLAEWQRSPFVETEQTGESVLGRPLWLVSVTDTAVATAKRTRVTVHARTHPSEVESLYATREMIRILIADSPLALRLRSACIFNMMPMYNPDGVELGYARENANGVDLERGWDSPSPQPEVAALKTLFASYMASESPIRVALNMHAAISASHRYFVFHHENGTSIPYTEMERTFIRDVRSYWPEGILDWNGFVSWTAGTPTYYPESWFWLNFGEDVLALTYEEVRNQDPPTYDRSAHALLSGILDYVDRLNSVTIRDPFELPPAVILDQNYPNPFHATTTIPFALPTQMDVRLSVFNVMGKEVAVLKSGSTKAGSHEASVDAAGLPSGVYLYRLQTGNYVQTRRMAVVK